MSSLSEAPIQEGRPIPKIIGRGKNMIRRRRSYHNAVQNHSYNLRSSSQQQAPCSCCSSYFQQQLDELRRDKTSLKTMLLRCTVRSLVINRWKNQREEKIRKLRGILQDRSNEIRDMNFEIQGHLREAGTRRTELREVVKQLDRSKKEVADLTKDLENERETVSVLRETKQLQDESNVQKHQDVISLFERLLPLLVDIRASLGTANTEITERIQAMECAITEYRTKEPQQQNLDEATPATMIEEIADSRSVLRRVISEALCGVCQDMFIDPVALPCGHVFCEFCIRSWFKRCRGCPVCRHRLYSCSQLHAIYQFRQVVELLNESRTNEDRDTRAAETTRRSGLREEILAATADHVVSRRSRDRGSSDRGFVARRRRVDFTGSAGPVPYPIPSFLPMDQPTPGPSSLIMDLEQQQQSPQMGPPGTSQGSFMSMLLNQTFSSIDRFMRQGGPPMIEYPGPSNLSSHADSTTPPHPPPLPPRIQDLSVPEGSPGNPILVPDDTPNRPDLRLTDDQILLQVTASDPDMQRLLNGELLSDSSIEEDSFSSEEEEEGDTEEEDVEEGEIDPRASLGSLEEID